MKKLVTIAMSLMFFSSVAMAKNIYKIYLAGPMSFCLTPKEKAVDRKKAIERFNKEVLHDADFKFVGIPPIDSDVDEFKNDPATAMKIFKINIDLMNYSDLIIANMTRFRGPSMDVGTAFEMGYMYALGKPVFGFYSIADTYCTADQKSSAFDCADKDSDEKTTYADKVKKFAGGFFLNPADSHTDKYTHQIEGFGLGDNLMMIGAVRFGSKAKHTMSSSFVAALHEAAASYRMKH